MSRSFGAALLGFRLLRVNKINMTSKNPRWINFNFNPWNKNISDCAIRAVVAATGLDYRAVCKRFGVSYVKGKGLRRDTGIDLDAIKETFSEYFDIVEDYYDNMAFVPDEFKNSKEDMLMQTFDLQNGIDLASGDTLNDFCDQYSGQGTFLVSLEGNPKSKDVFARKGGHIVCAKLGKNAKKQGFIDTWNSGEMHVDAYMRVVKTEPKNSPLHWKYDNEQHKFIV